MLKRYPDILTPKELRVILRVGKSKIYKMLSERKIPSLREGKKYLISKKDVIKYLETNKR